MVFDPKNRAKQFADATVYETAFFSSTVKKLEQQAQGILEQVLKENPTSGQRDAFEKAVCQEAQASFDPFDIRNWKYNRSKELRGSSLFQAGLLKGEKPNCDDPIANRKLVVDLLDIRFKKLGFRTPEFEELRTKYLSGKDSLSEDWRYIVDGLPIDFRSDSSKSIVIAVPFILKALPVGIATGISLSLATYGIGSGAVKVKRAIEDLNRIKDPREKSNAYRELSRGSSRMALALLIGLRAYGRIKEAPQEEPIFDTSSMNRPGRIEVVDLTKFPVTVTPTPTPLPAPILWRVPTGGGQATSTPGGLSAAGGLPERELWVNAQAAPVLTPQAPVVTPYSLTDMPTGKPLGFDSQGLLNPFTQTPKVPDGSSSLLSSLLTGFLGLDEAEIKVPSAFPDDPQKLPGSFSTPINVQFPTDSSKSPFLFPGMGQADIQRDPLQQIIDIEAASRMTRVYSEVAQFPPQAQAVYSTGKNGTGVDLNNIPKPLDQKNEDSCQTIGVLNGIQTVDPLMVSVFNPPRTFWKRCLDYLTNQPPPYNALVENIRAATRAQNPHLKDPEMRPGRVIDVLSNGTFPDLRIQPTLYHPEHIEDFTSSLFQEGTFAVVRHGYHVTTLVPINNPTVDAFVVQINSLGGNIQTLSLERFITLFNDVSRRYFSGDGIIVLRRIYRHR